VLTDEEEEEDKEEKEEKEEKPETKSEPKVRVKKESSKKGGEDYKSYSIEKLNDLLKTAIEKEDYERAAKIRDELGKRN
jgi:uncharacterized protein